MKSRLTILASVALLVLFIFWAKGQTWNEVTELRCEYLKDPVGIDVTTPRLSWKMQTDDQGQCQTAYQIIASSSLQNLSRDNGDLWNSGKIDSDKSINIEYGGQALESRSLCYWKVKIWDKNGKAWNWSKPASFTIGLLDPNDWQAQWIGLDKLGAHEDTSNTQIRLAARYLRKEFSIEKKVKRATATICGVGQFELSLNGRKISDYVLAPGQTEFNKRALYMTFELSGKQLAEGNNTIGVILGSGRYTKLRKKGVTHYGLPKMLFRLDIDYTDGTASSVVSDQTWKITTDGPITMNNEFDGEEYDATKEMPGWDCNNFDAKAWQTAEIVSPASPKIVAQMAEPIKIVEKVKPIAMTEPSPNVYIFDMGQNMVGWVQMFAKAPKGTKISLRFAERLKEDGTMYMDNIRGARVTDIYTAKGEGMESFEPKFVYHGFQFVEITGLTERPNLHNIIGKVVHDDLSLSGQFETNNAVINRIYKNAYWGIRGNYRSFPTDCPQRDERMGWLGDRAMGSKGESYIFMHNNLYAKWMQDIEDAQLDNGSVPDVAPSYWKVYNDDVTWPGAYIIICNMLYEQFGNIKPIEKHYDSLLKWVYHLKEKHLENGIYMKDTYGDWCMPPESPELIHSQDPNRKTSAPVLGTTYYYHIVKLAERFANLTNRPEDASKLAALSDTIRTAYNDRFLDRTNFCYDNNTTTANLLSIAFGLVPEELKEKVMANVARKTVTENNSHISTGLVGAQWAMRLLSEYGYNDLAYKIATNTTYPSWGYMAEKGATTIWELWNGDTADPAMNSGNHVMLLGDLIIWYYENLAGIKLDPDQPGFKHIVMKPETIEGLSRVKASHDTPYGIVKSSWEIKHDNFNWDITIPANATATVTVPSAEADNIRFNGATVNHSEYVMILSSNEHEATFSVASGSYRIESRKPKTAKD